MGNYYNDGEHIVVKKHKMIMFFSLCKVAFIFLIAFFLYIISDSLQQGTSEVSHLFVTIDFFIIFLLIHYAFFVLTTLLIKYYNNVIIISENTIVSIKCSLLLKDDIEVIDGYRITKVDGFIRGLLPNILGYGEVTIEEYNDEVRTFRYIPHPYRLLDIIKQQRKNLIGSNGGNIHYPSDIIKKD